MEIKINSLCAHEIGGADENTTYLNEFGKFLQDRVEALMGSKSYDKDEPLFYVFQACTSEYNIRLCALKNNDYHSSNIGYFKNDYVQYNCTIKNNKYCFKSITEFGTADESENISTIIGPLNKWAMNEGGDYTSLIDFIKSKSYITISYNDLSNFSAFINNNKDNLLFYSIDTTENEI